MVLRVRQKELEVRRLEEFPQRLGKDFISLTGDLHKIHRPEKNPEVVLGAFTGGKLCGVTYANTFDNGCEVLLAVGGTCYRGGEGDWNTLAGLVRGIAAEAEERNLPGANLDGLDEWSATRLRRAVGADEADSPFRLVFEECEGIIGLAGNLGLRVRDAEAGAQMREGVYVKDISQVPEYMIEAFIKEGKAPSDDRQEIRDAEIKAGAFHRGFLAGFVAANPHHVVGVFAIYIEPSARGVITEGQPTAGEKLMFRMVDEAKSRGLEGVDIGPLEVGGLRLFERMADQNTAKGGESSLIYREFREPPNIYGEIRFKKPVKSP